MSRFLTFSWAEIPMRNGARLTDVIRDERSHGAVHSAKKMHGQVTPLDRPLPPGEGRGEGLLLSPILQFKVIEYPTRTSSAMQMVCGKTSRT